jgi:hypothetical protein
MPRAVLLEATSVVLNAINRELGLIEETPAYLLQVHGASVVARLASGLAYPGSWLCATSESGDERCKRGGVSEVHDFRRGSSVAMHCAPEDSECRGGQ